MDTRRGEARRASPGVRSSPTLLGSPCLAFGYEGLASLGLVTSGGSATSSRLGEYEASGPLGSARLSYSCTVYVYTDVTYKSMFSKLLCADCTLQHNALAHPTPYRTCRHTTRRRTQRAGTLNALAQNALAHRTRCHWLAHTTRWHTQRAGPGSPPCPSTLYIALASIVLWARVTDHVLVSY